MVKDTLGRVVPFGMINFFWWQASDLCLEERSNYNHEMEWGHIHLYDNHVMIMMTKCNNDDVISSPPSHSKYSLYL